MRGKTVAGFVASKVSLELTDGQRLVAHSPNDQIQGIGDGSVVYVDLRDAKVFAPKGPVPPTNWPGAETSINDDRWNRCPQRCDQTANAQGWEVFTRIFSFPKPCIQ